MSARHVAAGRLGGLATSSRRTPEEMTKAAFAGRQSKLREQHIAEVLAEATGPLSDEELERRVEAKRRAYWHRLSMKGAEARRKKARSS